MREVAEQTLQAVNLPGGAYNFGSEADVSMYALAELFMKKTGMKLNLQEKSGGENLWMNCAKLKNAAVDLRRPPKALRRAWKTIIFRCSANNKTKISFEARFYGFFKGDF